MLRRLFCMQAFLQHLTASNGVSCVAPAAIRILNSKACRSALMFGTVLQPDTAADLIRELANCR